MPNAQLKTYFNKKGEFRVSKKQILEIIKQTGHEGLTNEEVWRVISPSVNFAGTPEEVEDLRHAARRQVDGRCSELHLREALLTTYDVPHELPNGKFSTRSKYVALSERGEPTPTKNEALQAQVAELQAALERVTLERDVAISKAHEIGTCSKLPQPRLTRRPRPGRVRFMKTNLAVGTEIYYTGDMANSSGTFKVVDFAGSYVTLQEIEGEGRRFPGIHLHQIGEVYQGHCNPRFVTEEARQDYRKARGL